MKNKKWIKHLNCKDCGWSKPTTFPDASIADIMFIEDIGCCPDCGGENFSIKTKRINLSKVNILNPLTWNKGYEEILDD